MQSRYLYHRLQGRIGATEKEKNAVEFRFSEESASFLDTFKRSSVTTVKTYNYVSTNQNVSLLGISSVRKLVGVKKQVFSKTKKLSENIRKRCLKKKLILGKRYLIPKKILTGGRNFLVWGKNLPTRIGKDKKKIKG